MSGVFFSLSSRSTKIVSALGNNSTASGTSGFDKISRRSGCFDDGSPAFLSMIADAASHRLHQKRHDRDVPRTGTGRQGGLDSVSHDLARVQPRAARERSRDHIELLVLDGGKRMQRRSYLVERQRVVRPRRRQFRFQSSLARMRLALGLYCSRRNGFGQRIFCPKRTGAEQ